jgi:hypothetical protein
VLADASIALSFANLIFFRAWHALLFEAETYFSSKDPAPDVLALYVNVVLVAAAAFILLRMAGAKKPPGFVSGVALWSLLVAAVLVYRPLAWEGWLAGRYGPLAPVLLIALPLALLVFLRRRVLSIARIVLLCATPFVLVTFGQAARLLLPQESQGPPLLLPARIDAPRVLWVILDELDYRAAFAQRPPGIELPELNRLTAEGFSASHALPPADDTRLSIPSLVSGRTVRDAKYSAAREMRITFAGEREAVPWSAAPSVFSRARDEGFNAAGYGWYFPYCWLFQHVLVSCEWAEFSTMQVAREQQGGVWASMTSQWRQLAHRMLSAGEYSLARRPLDAGLDFEEAKERVALARRIGGEFRRKRHQEMQASVIAAANDPRLGLVYAHFGVPHPPGMFDRRTGQLREGGGYLDNLALADRTIGEIRRAMEASGMWDRTTVLVTSDHAFRRAIWEAEMTAEDKALFGGAADRRVPFIVRFPGQPSPVAYEREFNTVVSADLLLEVLQGRIKTAEETARWLDARAAR